ncbi:MAG: iron-sulfur cluster assembly scaffold protein [Nostoc sp. NOS(2021)]|uniref:iron-sulfur cluster assembly scaffold protein n=1 Tax=Nostoc sp. NOS(2021) TaxID=2815407 RepID=UPI003457B067|nr:iron-sulfur cluster assembly scaffold protein [Nostoc sp. NOS(2021)]
MTLALDEAESTIEDIKFEGTGCALCLACADLMAYLTSAVDGGTVPRNGSGT